MLMTILCSLILPIIFILWSAIKFKIGWIEPIFMFIISFIIDGVFVYLEMPSLTLSNMLWINLIAGFIVGVLQYFVVNPGFETKHKYDLFGNIVIIIPVISFLIICIIGIISKSNVKQTFNSIKVENVKSDVAPTLKRGQTPVAITPKTVFNKISKAMSDVPNSNAFEIAENDDGKREIQAQYYKGKPVYVVPLQFRGFWQYNNQKTIPGYFRISATDPNGEPEFINKTINYSDSSYFGNNIDRNIYSAAPDYKQLSSNAQLEIDENGHPYYVSTLFKPKLFNNRIDYQRIQIAVEDAETGKVKIYDKNKTPKFIDENITSDVADNMNNDFGAYIHGWWNSFIGQKDVKQPTENGPEDGVTTIFDGKGSIHYLSDFTSTSSSNSALGYSMIDARTGLLRYYKTEGIMDTDGAIDNADRNYHAQNYHAEMPVLYSIDGHATWVMSVLDSSGLQRGFYYVDGQNPSIHADGSDVNTTLDAFRQALVNSGQKVNNSNAIKSVVKQGKVTRAYVSDKNALFMINNDKTIYQVSTSDFMSASLIRPGDLVSFKSGANGTNNFVTNFIDKSISK